MPEGNPPEPQDGFGLSAWSYVGPTGEHCHLVSPGDEGPAAHESPTLPPGPEAPYDNPGLSPHPESLQLPGAWGRVSFALEPLPPALLRHHSRCAELLVRALRPLQEHIQALVAQYGAERVGIVLGSSTGGIDATEVALAHERETGALPEDFVFEASHVYSALIRVVRGVVGADGPGFVVSTACSSSGKALASASRLLATGCVDAVISGGVDALCEVTLRGFGGLGILSKDACRPFDGARDGINIGEGASLLVLQRQSSSPFRLLGVGESSDAYHLTAPHPEGRGAILAMRRALAIAGLAEEDVSYVSAHGTGTVQNDETEARSIHAVFGSQMAYSSTKDRTGHQLGTAGATEAIFSLEAMRRGQSPANRTPHRLDEKLALQPSLQPTPLPERTALLSNSFAFGGSNVSVALGRRPSPSDNKLLTLAPVSVEATALWGLGFRDLEAWLQANPDPAESKAAARLLPPRARGRASALTRALAELYGQLQGTPDAPRFKAETTPLICGSAYGEMETTLRLLDQLAVDSTLSPARFQASVHNTGTGLISIATGSHAPSTAIAAGDGTLAMALLEAQAWLTLHGGQIVVLIADEDGPARLLRGQTFPRLGIGLLLRAQSEAAPSALGTLAPLTIGASAQAPDDAGEFAGAPAGWGLSLLSRIATRTGGETVVGYRHRVCFTPS